MPPTIAVGPADGAQVQRFLALAATHYQGEPVNDERVVRWRHLEAPNGPSTSVELVDDGTSVGRMWIQVHDWCVGGRTVRAANPVDFLIREDHRSLPTFLRLFKSTMREAEARSNLVYHTSNPVTDDLYRKLVKLTPVAELDGALLPIRAASLARSATAVYLGRFGRLLDAVSALIPRALARLARVSGLWLDPYAAPAEQAEVVCQLRKDERVCATRSEEWRSWRFKGAGAIKYEVLWVRRHGRVIGYVVTSDRDLDGVRGRFVVDLVLPSGRASWAVALWLQLAGRAAVAGRDALFFFYNRSNPRLAALARMPLITVNRSRLPQRVPVFVRAPKDPAPGVTAADFATGYYVLADFDLL
jgi:hypothetical protein